MNPPAQTPQDFFGADIQVGNLIHWTAFTTQSPKGRLGIVTKVTPSTLMVLTLAEPEDVRHGWRSRPKVDLGDPIQMKVQGQRTGYYPGNNPFGTVVVLPAEALPFLGPDADARWHRLNHAHQEETP